MYTKFTQISFQEETSSFDVVEPGPVAEDDPFANLTPQAELPPPAPVNTEVPQLEEVLKTVKSKGATIER